MNVPVQQQPLTHLCQLALLPIPETLRFLQVFGCLREQLFARQDDAKLIVVLCRMQEEKRVDYAGILMVQFMCTSNPQDSGKKLCCIVAPLPYGGGPA